MQVLRHRSMTWEELEAFQAKQQTFAKADKDQSARMVRETHRRGEGRRKGGEGGWEGQRNPMIVVLARKKKP